MLPPGYVNLKIKDYWKAEELRINIKNYSINSKGDART